MSTTATSTTLRCTRCGAEFACDPTGECWCKDESFRLPMPTAEIETCLCPKCLRKAAEQSPPHPSLSPRKRVERENI